MALFKRFYGNAHLLLVLTTLFWGGNTVAGRLAVGEISPMGLTCLRWLIVGPVMVILFRRALIGTWPIIRTRPWFMITMSITGLTAFNALFYFAAKFTTGVNISIISGIMPLLILLGAALFHRHKIGLMPAIGMAAAMVGVALVATHGDLGRLGALSFNPGDLLIMLANFLYATYTLGLRNRPPVPSIVFFAAAAPIAALASLPLLGLEAAAGALYWPSFQGWAVLAYVAVFPSLLAPVFFVRAVELIGAGRTSYYTNLLPVFGAALSVLTLGESFQLYHGAALLLVIAGIVMAEVKRAAPAPEAPGA